MPETRWLRRKMCIRDRHRAVNSAAELRNHAHILRFGVVGVHAADIGDAQAAVALNLRDPAAERVRVGFHQQCVLLVFAAQINQDVYNRQCLCRGFAPAGATRGLCDRPLDCFASPSKLLDF